MVLRFEEDPTDLYPAILSETSDGISGGVRVFCMADPQWQDDLLPDLMRAYAGFALTTGAGRRT